jgi:hypothetical protein
MFCIEASTSIYIFVFLFVCKFSNLFLNSWVRILELEF